MGAGGGLGGFGRCEGGLGAIWKGSWGGRGPAERAEPLNINKYEKSNKNNEI